MNMNTRKIIKEYIETPENVYEKLSGLDEESKNIVYLLEEMFATMKMTGLKESADDQKIAEMVDGIRNGKFTGDLERANMEAVRDVLMSVEKMSIAVKKEVPEVLMSVIERTLKATDKKKIPSLIVRFTENGLKTILSGINGMNLIPVSAPAMRSNAVSEKENNNIQIEQIIEDHKISYNILKESDNDLMLAMNFPDKIGRCRVFLKENERILFTENLNDGENSVSFSKLKPGFYDISIAGYINHSFSLLVA